VTASNLFSLFKISLENFFKVKFYIYKHLSIQPSELEEMEYYEFHYIVKELIEMIKAENEANKGQNEQTGEMMNSMKMPKFDMPKFSMPKL
jgi:hypothetical protein